MKIKISPANGDMSVIHFGPILRKDPKSKYQLFAARRPRSPDEQPKMELVCQGPIPRKGRLRVRLPFNEKCMVSAGGDGVAGFVHTANKVIEAPFYLSIDADPSTREMAREQARIRELQKKHAPNILMRAISSILR